ncbi:MAG: hypothetical protein RID53_33415 [Coleofasciculus sp. B1-GNL1-01]
MTVVSIFEDSEQTLSPGTYRGNFNRELGNKTLRKRILARVQLYLNQQSS